jgi:hypothetical protein
LTSRIVAWRASIARIEVAKWDMPEAVSYLRRRWTERPYAGKSRSYCHGARLSAAGTIPRRGISARERAWRRSLSTARGA